MRNKDTNSYLNTRLLQKMRLLEKIYKKYKSILFYVLFGVLTTIVSILVFIVFYSVFNFNELFANIISWIFAVTFAYLTNRKWVFNSVVKGWNIIREIIAFFSGRVLTLIIEEILLLIFVTFLSINATMVKILSQVIVLLLNYIISKFIVFRRKRE